MKLLVDLLGRLYLVVFVVVLYSCQSENFEQKVYILKSQLDELRRENDSLKSILESEKFGAFLLADGYDGISTSKSEMDFVLSLNYSRNDLISQIRYNIFYDEESMEKAFYESDFSEGVMLYDHELGEFNGTVEFKIESLADGVNFIAGQLMFHEKSQRNPIPFQYSIIKK